MYEWTGYLLTGLIGGVVAVSEIVSRYRDDPWAASTSRGGVIYVLFNAAVSLGVFYLIRDVFPVRDDPRSEWTLQQFFLDVFLAGGAALAVMRTSFMTVRVNDKDVQVGLAAIVEIFRNTIDRDVDRLRAGPRSMEVAKTMNQVSFDRAQSTLTSVSLNLMQNISAEERATIEQKIAALANQTDRPDESKAIELGLILAGSIGFKNLESSVEIVRDSITTAMTRRAVVEDAISTLDSATVISELPITCLSISTALTPDGQDKLRDQIDNLMASEDISVRVKAINVALLLAHLVGEENFKTAVALLKSSKKVEPVIKPEPTKR